MSLCPGAGAGFGFGFAFPFASAFASDSAFVSFALTSDNIAVYQICRRLGQVGQLLEPN
jgi:hypothetical protein